MDYSIFDYLIDSVFVINERKEFVYANESAANLSESTVKRLIGKPCYETLQLKNTNLFWMPNGSIGKESSSSFVETNFKSKSKEGRGQVTIQPAPPRQDDQRHWLVYIHDVSLEDTLHRKYKIELEAKDKAFQDLKDAQDQLIQVGKMATLGQFVATVSHELNNPLAIVHGSAEELKEAVSQKKPDPEIAVALAGFILDASTRMIKILRNMRILAHGQSEKINFEKTDIAQVLANSVRFIRHIAQKSEVVILNRCQKGLPDVNVDAGLIDQLAMNLIKNSIDALVESETNNPEVVVDAWVDKASKSLVISFKDNGPGIPEEHRGKLFKPFFTTKAVGKGTGLGLMICHKIVERHGGKISLDPSTPGANFLVQIPLEFRG